jgi:hypothetical protein
VIGEAIGDKDKCEITSAKNTLKSVLLCDFNKLNRKTKNFTLNDVWVRQLMTVSGVSAEKASHLARRYPTSRRFLFAFVASYLYFCLTYLYSSFYLALKSCSNDDEREKMIQAAGGSGRKSIGPTVTKKLVNVFFRCIY